MPQVTGTLLPKPKKLGDLFSSQQGYPRLQEPEVEVYSIHYDSRTVQPGGVFIALPGGNTDGHAYIPDAIHRGAVAVVGTQPLINISVPYIQVKESRKALAELSAAFFDYPARQLTMIGVTGTDGKTTTTNLLFHILKEAGLNAGMISTVSARIGGNDLDTGFHVTTPEAPEVQAYLAQMVASGITHCVLEVTSHGLDQHRVAHCEFDVAVLTNITHEHLDYHGNYDYYLAAKGKLFSGLRDSYPKEQVKHRGAVINRDDTSFDYLIGIMDQVDYVSYGIMQPANFQGSQIKDTANNLEFAVIYTADKIANSLGQISSSLIGEYNVYNCLAAISAAHRYLDLPFDVIRKAIASMPGIPGRMERISLGQPFVAIVDFAHTPNALQKVLISTRKLVQMKHGKGRVIVVFGSAGLRDRDKRRMMAEVAAELADFSIMTSEDPRTESVDQILEEMAYGMSAHSKTRGLDYELISDRREAIRMAVSMARADDLVIACGKGHEQSMCFGEIEYLWDDRIAMRSAISELLGIPGPEMPYLPV
jgi:UDP-N-acetylmuramoyl-L-alanyl-D-glutamate--2,6-diaminopimelate ligase